MKVFYLIIVSVFIGFVSFAFPFEIKIGLKGLTIEAKPSIESKKKPNPPKKAIRVSKPKNYVEKHTNSDVTNLLAPSISVSKSVTVQGGGNATPGGVLNYSITVSNTASGSANDASGVIVTDQLVNNLTLVAGSVKATPIAANDTYNSVGNVGITLPAASGVTANDANPLPANALTITAFDATSTNGGTVTMTTSGANLGAFTYIPAAGYSGNDTFTYTIDNGSGISNTSRTATVTITVSTPIWFINNTAGSGGNGTLSSPFQNWSDFATANVGGAGKPEANDIIFIAAGNSPYTYSGTATLLNGQKVLGEGASVSLESFAGITVPSYTRLALPTTNGQKPILTSSGTTITLGGNNTLRGFDMGNSTTDIAGSSFGTLTASEMALTGNGAALDLSTGNLATTFTSISSTNAAAAGISLSRISGSLTSTGGTIITNPTSEGIAIFLNSSVNANFGNTTISGSGAPSLLITNSTTVTTFGSLNLSPDAGTIAIQASGTDTITCTSGTITASPTAPRIAMIFNGTNSALKLTLNIVLTTVNVTGGGNAISLANTSGSFSITGTGSAGTGGTIQNTINESILLNNAASVSLNYLNISNSSKSCYSATNLSGTCAINNSTFSLGTGALSVPTTPVATSYGRRCVHILNENVAMTLNVNNSTFTGQLTNSPNDNHGIAYETTTAATNSTVGTLNIKNSTFNRFNNFAVYTTSTGSAITDVGIQGTSVNYDGGTNFVGGAFHLFNLRSAKTTFNIINNTSILTKGGFPIEIYSNNFDGSDFTPASGRGLEGKFNNNILTRHSTDAGTGVFVLVRGKSNGVVQVSGNTIIKGDLTVQANENTPSAANETARLDATITNNTIEQLLSNYAIVVQSGNGNTPVDGSGNGTFSNVINCVKISGNTINPTNSGALGLIRFRTEGITGGNASRIWREGVNGTSETSSVNYWNNNGNIPTGTSTFGSSQVRDSGFGILEFRAAGTCLTPNNAASARIAVPEYISSEPALVIQDNTLVTNAIAEELNIEEPVVIEEDFLKNETSPTPKEENSSARLLAGETVLVNGSGSGFALPAGKNTIITFSATISNTPSTCAITNQASASGSNFATVNSNTTTTNVVVPAPTAVTPSSATPICIGQSVSLVATCSSGTVQWYNAAATGTLLGTTTSLGTFTQSPTVNTTYQAACLVGGCESTRVNTGLVTLNPLPTITVSTSPAICEGATSFTIPYTTTTGTPTTYSISGTGITTVTNATLPASTITVNLSSAATGSSYSYTLTVRNANGCVSNNVTGSVNVNPIPTITTQASPAICAGATSFTIPYTAITGTPTTYSISGTGITTVNNGTLTSSPITVNLSSGASGSSISYILTVRNAGGCTSSNVNGSVTVNPLPTITLGSISAICAGATTFSIPYTATTESPITYSISGIRIPTVTNAPLPSSPIIVNVNDTQSGEPQFTQFTVTNANGCTSSNISRTVTVNPLPVFNVGASPAICKGASSFTVPTISNTSGIVSYSFSGSGITTITDAPYTPRPQFIVGISDAGGATGSSYSYIFTVKNSNGCTSNNITGNVTVNSTPAPTSPIATPSNFVVAGTTTLTATGCNSPSTITWYDTANSTVALPNNTPMISANKTFFARCTGTNTCVSEPSTNVSVTYTPCTPLASSPGNVIITWTGLLSTDWNNACNWNPAWVPDATNAQAVIPPTTNQPTINGTTTATIKVMYLNNGATLTVNNGGTLNVRGNGGSDAGISVDGTLNNNGNIRLETAGAGTLTLTEIAVSGNGTITNNGTILVNNSANGIIFTNNTVATPLTNSSTGTITVSNGGSSFRFFGTSNRSIQNDGLINLNSGSFALNLISGASVLNTGIINITSGNGISNPSGSTITNNACGKIIMSAGTYTNAGTTTNAGLIQMPNAHDFTNTGTFTNNGVLKANTVSGITNNKMVVTNACPIFTLGGSNNYTVSGIFTDAGATTSAGTYTSVGNKFTANNTIPIGTQTLYASVTDGTCTFTVPFDFNNIKPTAVSISTTNACLGSSVTLSATCTSGTVTWYGSATGTSSLGTGGTFSYVPSAGTGQAFYAACETTNCNSGRTITSNFVNVNPIPSAPTVTLTSAAIVCQPATLNLTASGCAGTVTWSQGAATGTSLTISAAGTYNVSATCTVNNCPSVASTGNNGLEIKAKPNAPTITPPASLSVCSPSTLTLTASGCTGGTVVWSQGAASGTSLTVSAIGTYSISATCTINGCTSDASSTITGLEIKAKPNAPKITPPTTLVVCSPETLTLTANGCEGIVTWSQGAATGTSLTLSAVGTYSISATCTVNGCISDASTSATGLEIKAKPNAPIITPPTTLVVCSPSTLTLTASGCTGGTVVWSQGAASGTSLTVSTIGTYSISATCTINGCTSDASSTITGLEILTKPNPPTITPPTQLVVCSPSTLILTASGCGGTIVWSNNTSGTSLTLSTIGTYAISATCFIGECSSNASTTITGLEIKAKPNAPIITPPASLSVCSPSTLTLTASGCAGIVTWSQGAATGTSLTLSAVGTYSISATCTINGCTSDASTTVTGLEIKAKPNAPTITPPTTLVVCSPETLTLTASGCAGIVTWSQGAATGTSLTLSAVGTYSVSATCTTNGCSSDASTSVTGLEIKAKPNAPIITPPASLSVCSPETLTLTASGCAGIVTWSQGAATGTSLTLSAVGTYSISATCTINGCTSDASSTVTGLEIKAKPNAPIITPPATLVVCSPSTLTLTASGCAGIVTWSQGAATGTSLTLSAVGTYSVSATCTVNGCSSDASTSVTGLEIKAKPNAPIITPPASLSVCSPSTLTLTASGCAGIVTWSQGAATGTSLTLSAVGTYSISATCTINGCTSDASTTVTGLEIKAKPNAPTITPPTTLVVCSPETLTLTASGCAGIVTWSQGAATGTSLTLSAVGTYSISATCTVNGCSSDASTSVTGLEIKAKPNAPIITPPASLSVCSPSTLTLTASGCAGIVTWSQGAATGTSLTLSAVGTYSISATCTINGCTSDASTTVTGLEIKAKPNAPTITPPTTLVVCSPETLTLTASGCAGIVTWSQGAATGTSLTLSAVGTYSISATCTVNGCSSDASTSVTGLEIKAKPNAPIITPPASLSVCSPSTLTLTASGCAGIVTWSQGAATGTSLTLSAVGTYSISATCTINGCTSDASTSVTGLEIKAKPNAPIITPPASLSVCSPSTLTLTASGCEGMITWSQGAATGTSLTLSSVGTYSVTTTCTVNGCTSDASTPVTGLEIKATPVITATNTGPYTVGQTISLTGTGGSTYNWTGPNNFSSTSSTPTISNALPVNGGVYTLSVTGINGCNAVATTNVVVNGIDPCDPSRVVDYTYVKAGTPYQALFPLTDGMIINQRSDQVSILVNPVCPSVTIESFEMNIQGPELNWNILQNVAPYALFDNLGLDVWGRNFNPGNYTLTVTGYAQDNKGGGITYGPKVITFTVVGNLAAINAPTLSKTEICAGSSVDVTFSTTGTFNGINQFQVELSDSSGSFSAPVLIGTTNSVGTLNCTIPQSTLEGSKYLIRVTSTNQVVVSNPAMSLVTVHPFTYNLVSPTNNLTGTSTKKAVSTINASNKVTSPANVTYQAGNSILLTPGFESGAVFKAEIQGCNN